MDQSDHKVHLPGPHLSLATFQKRYQGNIDVDLQLHPNNHIEGLVQEGHIDVGITSYAPREHFAQRVTRFAEDSWVGVQSPNSTRMRCVYLARDGAPEQIDEKRMQDIQWQPSTETAKRLVQEGMGQAILLRSAVKSELDQGMLVQWDGFQERPITLSIVTRPAERLGVSLWNLIDHLRSDKGNT